MIPKSTFMAGLDKYNRAVQSSLTAGLVESLPSVGSVFNNSLWYELDNDTPVLKFRRGNVDCTKRPDKKLHKNLAVWLRFTNSMTDDACGNVWTVTGTDSVSATKAFIGNAGQFDGATRLDMSGTIPLGGQDFTVDFWGNMSSSANGGSGYARFFGIRRVSDNKTVFEMYKQNTNGLCLNACNNSYQIVGFTMDKLQHIAVVYNHSAKKLRCYIGGKLQYSPSTSYFTTRADCRFYLSTNLSKAGYMIGSVDEFRVWDGVARWTSDFTPPTASDYL